MQQTVGNPLMSSSAATPTRRGHIFVISGPSGAGKDSVITLLLPQVHVEQVVTMTARQPRPGEIDGVHYRFVTPATFATLQASGELLESALVHGNWYGVPADGVRAAVARGSDVLIKVDPQGARTIKRLMPDAIFIFIRPASLEELRERLIGRASETPEEQAVRLHNATDELADQVWFDYVVDNPDGHIDVAVERVRAIIAKYAEERHEHMHEGYEPSATRERNVALELVRVTEAAALNAAIQMGRGDKIAVDDAAVQAMRSALDGVDMDGVVVIGEGEKDEAPMLYIGEHVGNGHGQALDVAVDPVDGTTLTALGLPGAIAVVATAERGTMYAAPPGVYYMEKIAVGPAAAREIELDAPVAENLRRVARVRACAVSDIVVTVLDRPRHEPLIKQIRDAGARIRLIRDGDVIAAIQAAMEDYKAVDVYMGIGGAPEAVLAAAAIKCLGGEIITRVWPRTEAERAKLQADGIDLARIYRTNDLVQGSDVSFAATGITGDEMLRGVEFIGTGARTNSVMMRSRSGTVRFIEARHRWNQKFVPHDHKDE
jgi:fructose-1,6-bisphosphatase II